MHIILVSKKTPAHSQSRNVLILDKNHANHSECMWSHRVIELEAVGTSGSYEIGEAE